MNPVALMLRILLFLVATFTFIVLIDHGPANFWSGAVAELREMVAAVAGKKD